ncbi:Neuronal acetylcholine receptor subunit alpha-6 [Holothuria leucospilota]|uniref:Neuronal acetylcholine receptor subunit alpha-6 n=1 Tax=Holothuria leucospilota TaxID=206669 RepID=A0A9Q1BI85_HOLLE|nr:Neuronal acetylcholine receptor subunit alpha-6 [Holothuria leucospilota]
MRLSWDPSEFDGVGDIVLDVDEIWTPKIYLSNSVSKDSLHVISRERGSVILSSQGHVQLGTPIVVSTHCPMQVRYFPFDVQVCQFNFMPVNQLFDQMALSAQQSQNPSALVSLQWNLLNCTVTSYVYHFHDPNTNKSASFTGVLICLYLQRNPNYYISNIIVPSTFMCCLAFATFLATPESGERISLGVSMVLGLTVFQLLIADTLPISSKQSPILTNYLAVNFILACLVVPLSLANINIACMDKKLKILKYGWVEKVFVEWLPCCLCVSTIDERETESNQADPLKVTNDQGQLETKDAINDKRLKEYSVDQISPTTWEHYSTSTTKVTNIVFTFFLLCLFLGYSLDKSNHISAKEPKF